MARGLVLVRRTDAAQLTRLRARLRAGLRAHLDARGFVEADPPPLLPHAGQEPWLLPPPVALPGLEGGLWLQTSPELCLRRLVCAGLTRVYALGYAFRGGIEELSTLHQPQFTLLEWYRPGERVEDLVQDVLGLARSAARALELAEPREVRRWSLAEALRELAGCDPDPLFAGDGRAFAAAARAAGVEGCRDEDEPAQLLSRVLVERVEPALRERGGWAFLHGYPRCAAALARVEAGPPPVAQRVEAYLNGVEIANGWVELDDPRELERRWEEERAARCGPPPPRDEGLLAELARGPGVPIVGMALGVDRLALALSGAAGLAQVLPFHLARSEGGGE